MGSDFSISDPTRRDDGIMYNKYDTFVGLNLVTLAFDSWSIKGITTVEKQHPVILCIYIPTEHISMYQKFVWTLGHFFFLSI